jgi:hypothetical protein
LSLLGAKIESKRKIFPIEWNYQNESLSKKVIKRKKSLFKQTKRTKENFETQKISYLKTRINVWRNTKRKNAFNWSTHVNNSTRQRRTIQTLHFGEIDRFERKSNRRVSKKQSKTFVLISFSNPNFLIMFKFKEQYQPQANNTISKRQRGKAVSILFAILIDKTSWRQFEMI